MYKRRTVAPPTSKVTKRLDVGRIRPFLDETATGANMPSQIVTGSIPPALSISLRSFKIPLKRKDTTEPKPENAPTRTSRPAAATKPPEVLENSTRPRPFVPKPSRHRKYGTFDRRARRTPDSTNDTAAIPSFVQTNVQIPDVPPTAPNLDDPRVRARLARETVQHDSHASHEVAPVEIPIHLPADSPNLPLQSTQLPSTSFQDQLESMGVGSIPSPEVCPNVITEGVPDQSLAPESWSYEVLDLSDFMMDPTLEPSFLAPIMVPEARATENTEEPQQAVVHCLPLPSFPEPPKIDLEFLLDSSLGTLPMAQKLKWIDHAVKRLDYFCDLYKYRENFQKIISSWNYQISSPSPIGLGKTG